MTVKANGKVEVFPREIGGALAFNVRVDGNSVALVVRDGDDSYSSAHEDGSFGHYRSLNMAVRSIAHGAAKAAETVDVASKNGRPGEVRLAFEGRAKAAKPASEDSPFNILQRQINELSERLKALELTAGNERVALNRLVDRANDIESHLETTRQVVERNGGAHDALYRDVEKLKARQGCPRSDAYIRNIACEEIAASEQVAKTRRDLDRLVDCHQSLRDIFYRDRREARGDVGAFDPIGNAEDFEDFMEGLKEEDGTPAKAAGGDSQ